MSSQALIDKIVRTAEAEADALTNEMLHRAAENEKQTLERALLQCEEIKRASAEKCDQILRISKLNSGLLDRKSTLHARRAVLDEAFDAAYAEMEKMPREKRASFLTRLIKAHAPSHIITVSASPADEPAVKASLPEIAEALSAKFGKPARITVLADSRIKGGVYISSDLADTDATLDAIFEELRETCENEVDKLLFPHGAENV